MLPLIVPVTTISNNMMNGSTTLIQSSDNIDDKYQYRLFIHFDINETILIGDDAGGDTRDDCLNKIIAKSAFVQIPSPSPEEVSIQQHNIQYSATTLDLEPTHWWDGTPIQSDTTTSTSTNTINNNEQNGSEQDTTTTIYPPLYTGWVWPKNTCPYYRTVLKDKKKPFIMNDGLIYKPLYDKIQQIIDEPKFDSNTTRTEYPIPITNIIPSFFDTLIILFPSEISSTTTDTKNDDETNMTIPTPETEQEQHYLTQYPISIILRTMGTDLYKIANVITLFAQGKHPNYPYYKNSKLVLSTTNLFRGRWKKKVVVDHCPTTTGSTIVIASSNITKEEQQQQYVKGRTENGEESTMQEEDRTDDDNINNDQYVWQLFDSNDNCIAQNDTEVLNYIHSQTICGIQDDYMFWKNNNFHPWSGKPIWIEQKKKKNDNNKNHHILLDDNM
jgi:hypothetical protein